MDGSGSGSGSGAGSVPPPALFTKLNVHQTPAPASIDNVRYLPSEVAVSTL